jgi:dephospho-CoA kinase
MFLIGLTGGIAAGKSTVAKLWQELGGIEIDADQVARDVVAKGTPGLAAVITAFGDEFLSSDGDLNRKALAERIFQDTDSRLKLESIIHPLVRKAVQERLSILPEDSMVVYTVPLLVEANVDLPFDAVVTVEAPEEVRISRMVENRGMTAVQAKQRIAAQAKPIERAANADYILNSNQSIDLLMQDARSLWKEFQKRASN